MTTKDAYGNGPFTEAKNNKNHVMMEYLKVLESEEWHNFSSLVDCKEIKWLGYKF